jgi:hypothetical protein
MRKTLDRYPAYHKPTLLCEAGIFRDVLAYHGQELTLPMCFGLSGALGFSYGLSAPGVVLATNYFSPVAIASPLMPFYLQQLTRIANVWTKGGRTQNHQKLWGIITANINEGRPVAMKVETRSYFGLLGVPGFEVASGPALLFKIGGHTTQVIGYDDEKSTLLVVEAFIRQPLELPADKFLASCVVGDGYFPPEGEWTTFYIPSQLPPLKRMLYQSMRRVVHQILHPYAAAAGYVFGLDGLEAFARDIFHWPEQLTVEELRISLGLYYNFQRISPKQSSFREMYADFLDEAATHLGRDLFPVSEAYRLAGQSWAELSERILAGLKNSHHSLFQNRSEGERILREIVTREREAVSLLARYVESRETEPCPA